MKKILLFLLANLQLGCAFFTIQPAPQREPDTSYNIPRSIDKIIKGLEGCTKEFVFEAMGLPDDEKIIDGKKYFYWSLNENSTGFWTGEVNSHHCTIHAQVNNEGIIENISYTDFRNGCKYRYAQIVRYYRTHPAQSPQTCPNRTDLQGNHNIK
ncbi:MAG: hypothetical protein ACI351_00610 [Candidatus Avelusimicrobium sp.]|uniref:hypothetical protein n=1 Tax=Candidatus Avelusimicrobium sp. TaxID=3048833 RepID=UPI003EFD4E00